MVVVMMSAGDHDHRRQSTNSMSRRTRVANEQEGFDTDSHTTQQTRLVLCHWCKILFVSVMR